jgi:hypothetical protein
MLPRYKCCSGFSPWGSGGRRVLIDLMNFRTARGMSEHPLIAPLAPLPRPDHPSIQIEFLQSIP